jgi:DNA-directed RNA polymerase sigma subunit (sigma70/sigma32)
LHGIRAEVYQVNSAIRVPPKIQDLIRSIKRYIKEYNLENDCNPTKQQIATKFELSQDKILLYLCVISPVKSLNRTYDSGNQDGGASCELLDIIPSQATSPEDYVLSHELKSIIKQVLQELPFQEATIIDAYFNISGSFPKPKTLADLAEKHNTYTANIRKIINKGLRLIRQSNHMESLRYYSGC